MKINGGEFDFETLFMDLPFYVCYKDIQGTTLMGNRMVAKLAGFSDPKMLEGMKDQDMPWGELAHNYWRHDEDAYNGLLYRQLDPFMAADGYQIILAEKKPLLDQQGNSVAVTAIGFEVTHKEIIAFTQLIDKSSPLDNGRSLTIVSEDYLNTKPNMPSLTRREMECLFFLLRGESMKRIAQVLSISPRTVEYHAENLRNKFSCNSKSELLDKATNFGFRRFIPDSFFAKKLHKASL